MQRHKRLCRKSVMSRAKIKAKLDAVHSKLVRLLYGSKCVVCGSTDRVGCGHIFSRNHETARWDLEPDGNCHPQCWPCNFKHTYDTYPYYNWYLGKFGREKLDELHRRWSGDTPYRSRVAMEDLLHRMEERLEEEQTHKPSEKMVARLRKEELP